jgi:septum formation topological specificity factor MinE
MTEFFVAVAARSKRNVDDVRVVLDRYGVRPWVAPPASPALTIEEIYFAGRKPGEPEDFGFAWKLGVGVWAMSSVKNDVGKSTVLQVIRWLLSGRDGVDTVTRPMIARARLRFRIGEELIAVALSGARGQETGTITIAGIEQPISSASFETTMDEVMLERLGLRPLARWQKFADSDDGRPTHRGWTSFIPALFLPAPSSDALLGSTVFESGMLLQVFLGLPWFSTDRQADVALKQLAMSERDDERRSARDREADAAALAASASALNEAQARLAALPDARRSDQRLRAATQAVTTATRTHLDAEQALAVRTTEVDDADRLLTEGRRAARVLKETVAAGAVFSELKAEACPRCELDIGSDRRASEAEESLCMVCGRKHQDAPHDARDALERAEATVLELTSLHADAVAAAAAAASQAKASEHALSNARREARDSEPNAALHERRLQAEVAVARAEGALQEIKRRTVTATAIDAHPDEAVLKAARNEAQARIKDTDLFARLNTEILTVAHKFGLVQIDSVAIDRRSSLPVMKGDVKQPFSDLSASEKLRLRIATVIALLRVTQSGQPGRHPGLLVIDSPAADEVADTNLDQMFAELLSLAEQSDRLQVLLATTRADAAAAALPTEQVRFVPEGEYLW